MGRITSETPWLDKLEAVKAAYKENPNLTNPDLIAKFKFGPSQASYYASLHQCLDQAAIEKIREQALNLE